MAKPRVFVSSTFYDLRSVRDDLDRFIREAGYEPVRHERGHVSYGNDEPPEQYAYREIESCEILVCVIGGKFGTKSGDGHYSITQKELKTAIELGKQIYVFIEDGVFHEHRHYLANKGVDGIRYTAVDTPKIHEFIEEIYALPRGNPVFPFSVSSNITMVLSEQWAGLFHRLLNENSAKSQTVMVEELQRSLQTVGQLVQFLKEEKGKGQAAIEEILFSNHPVFDSLNAALKNPYRIYFTNYRELDRWLSTAKLYESVEDFMEDFAEFYEWRRIVSIRGKDETRVLYVSKSLFSDDGKLKVLSQANWDDSYVRIEYHTMTRPKIQTDDDIPF